jgi:hypothetical protein
MPKRIIGANRYLENFFLSIARQVRPQMKCRIADDPRERFLAHKSPFPTRYPRTGETLLTRVSGSRRCSAARRADLNLMTLSKGQRGCCYCCLERRFLRLVNVLVLTIVSYSPFTAAADDCVCCESHVSSPFGANVDPSGGFPNLGKSNARVHRQRPSNDRGVRGTGPSDLPKSSSGKPSTCADGLVVISNLDRPFAPKA